MIFRALVIDSQSEGHTPRERCRSSLTHMRLCLCIQAQVEKNMLMHTQLKLVEEQVKVLSEEISVYRQLEVYNTTLQHEFRALRERWRRRADSNATETGATSVKVHFTIGRDIAK